MNAPEELLTLAEAAKEIPTRRGKKISIAALQRWCRDSKIPARKVGGGWLILRSEFERWKAEGFRVERSKPSANRKASRPGHEAAMAFFRKEGVVK